MVSTPYTTNFSLKFKVLGYGADSYPYFYLEIGDLRSLDSQHESQGHSASYHTSHLPTSLSNAGAIPDVDTEPARESRLAILDDFIQIDPKMKEEM